MAVLWLSLALSITVFALELDASLFSEVRDFTWWFAGMMLFTYVFYAGLIIQVSRRRNWARILLLVLALIGPVVLFYPWPEIDNSYWTVSASVSHIGFLILDFIALYLLFTGEGAAWFARRTKEAP